MSTFKSQRSYETNNITKCQGSVSLTELRLTNSYQALELFACFRLAARINDLKEAGHNIQTEMKRQKNGKKIAVYSLPKIQKQGELF